MKKFSLLFLFIIVSFCSAQQRNDNITADEIINHIKYLSSEELRGRLTGTPDIMKAAEYIKNEFVSYNLKPAFGENYFQEFSFVSTVAKGPTNSINFSINNKIIDIRADEFTPLPFSGSVSLTGDLVFAGYGISSTKLGYDDYKDIDVKDKIVVVFNYYPNARDPKSQFAEYSNLRQKAKTAQDMGAKGMILVNGYDDLPNIMEDRLVQFRYDNAPLMKDFLVVQIKRQTMESVFSNASFSLKDFQTKINSTVKPASALIKGLSTAITSNVYLVQAQCYNVAAILEGTDPELKNEYIVIGAHYDHLGVGEFNSLSKSKEPEIHYGADDNASGTAGVLELAQKFASNRSEIKRSFIFVAFSGEELGLLGSSYFANNPPVETNSMVTMINLDMIGRLDSLSSLVVYGTGTASNWNDLLNKYNDNFKLTFNPDGYGPSDHSSFYSKGVPVLFFFTGVHSDYHRPTDTYDKINSLGQEKVLKYIYNITNSVANGDERPDYISVPRKQNEMPAGGWRVYVGTVPDFGSNEEGYKISAVAEGSPAAKCGMKAGDILVKFGSKSISNIYDYTYALKDYAPGDKVDIVVLRNNKELSLTLELGMR